MPHQNQKAVWLLEALQKHQKAVWLLKDLQKLWQGTNLEDLQKHQKAEARQSPSLAPKPAGTSWPSETKELLQQVLLHQPHLNLDLAMLVAFFLAAPLALALTGREHGATIQRASLNANAAITGSP